MDACNTETFDLGPCEFAPLDSYVFNTRSCEENGLRSVATEADCKAYHDDNNRASYFTMDQFGFPPGCWHWSTGTRWNDDPVGSLSSTSIHLVCATAGCYSSRRRLGELTNEYCSVTGAESGAFKACLCPKPPSLPPYPPDSAPLPPPPSPPPVKPPPSLPPSRPTRRRCRRAAAAALPTQSRRARRSRRTIRPRRPRRRRTRRRRARTGTGPTIGATATTLAPPTDWRATPNRSSRCSRRRIRPWSHPKKRATSGCASPASPTWSPPASP